MKTDNDLNVELFAGDVNMSSLDRNRDIFMENANKYNLDGVDADAVDELIANATIYFAWDNGDYDDEIHPPLDMKVAPKEQAEDYYTEEELQVIARETALEEMSNYETTLHELAEEKNLTDEQIALVKEMIDNCTVYVTWEENWREHVF